MFNCGFLVLVLFGKDLLLFLFKICDNVFFCFVFFFFGFDVFVYFFCFVVFEFIDFIKKEKDLDFFDFFGIMRRLIGDVYYVIVIEFVVVGNEGDRFMFMSKNYVYFNRFEF